MRQLLLTCGLAFCCLCSCTGQEKSATPAPTPVGDQDGSGAGTRKQGSDWPAFLGPFGTSVSSEKGIITPWPAQGLRLVWHKKVGAGYAMPVISQGKLYHHDRIGDHARLTCMNSETGALLWKYEYPTDYRDAFNYSNGPRCCPIVDGDRVYLFGAEGTLLCVSTTGKLVWKIDTAREFNVYQNFFGVGSTPVIEGDLLIAQIGGSPPKSDPSDFLNLKGNGSGIVAFDKYTGKIRYKISDELASYAVPVLTTIDGRRWCFVFARGGLVAFNPADGKIDFHFPFRCEELESVNAANPVVVGNHVLISETYGPGSCLLKVRPGGYDVVWSDAKKPRKSLQCHWMTPIHHNGYIYGCSGRHTQNAQFRCIELATGKIMWSEPGLTRTSLLMVDDHFICLGEDGSLRLLKVNPQKYEEVSQLEVIDPASKRPLLDYPCWAAPILSHGLLYLHGEGQLVCLELIAEKK